MSGGADATHATLITTLPYSDADTVPTTAGLWYKYVGTSFPNEISVFAYAATLATQRLRIYSPDGVTAYPPLETTNFATSRPLQIPVVNGVTYYFNVYNQVGAYTFSVIAGPNEIVPIGSIFNSDSNGGWPLALLSGIDGHPLRYFHPFPCGESGDVIATGVDTGRVLVHDRLVFGGDDHLKLYSPQFELLADLDYTSGQAGALYPIRAHRTNKIFYVGKPEDPLNAGNSSVTTVTSAGAFGPTTWNFSAAHVIFGIAPSIDETILYTTRVSTGVPRVVGRWDLVSNVGLTDLAAAVSNYRLDDIMVLADDTILVAYKRLTANVTPYILRYDTAGAILNTYTLTGAQSEDVRLAQAIDDPVSFWVWTKTNATESLSGPTTLNRYQNLRVSDGTILSGFSVPQFNHGVYIGAKSATPIARFGSASSCPFLILREAINPVFLYNRLSGVYQISLGKTNDTYHNQLIGDGTAGSGTTNVKIPDPFAIVPTE